LGTFEVAVNGVTATNWRGNRGRMLLAYLLLHRNQSVGCEVLAALFWPEASPSQARNRLHVTLHGLRRDLRAVTDLPVLVYARGYRVNPGLKVEIDVDVFDELVGEARQAEADGDADRALKAYEAAIPLSGGDLLEDAPYEEWTILPREQHHVARLRALDRLADLQFQAGAYDDCAETCQRLLAIDYCREDVHRLLMRCYSRLNQAHLALHQYKSCCRQLRAELQLEPDRETCQLHDLIRKRILV
jgi:DNA-binding SARP family transcriptional activator